MAGVADSPPASYGRAVAAPAGGRWLQYWRWHEFNRQDRGVLRTGRHAGDWELVQVRVDRGEQPVEAGLPRQRLARRLLPRPVRDRTFPDPNDEARGDGSVIRPRLVVVAADSPSSMRFTGRWGAGRSSASGCWPASPCGGGAGELRRRRCARGRPGRRVACHPAPPRGRPGRIGARGASSTTRLTCPNGRHREKVRRCRNPRAFGTAFARLSPGNGLHTCTSGRPFAGRPRRPRPRPRRPARRQPLRPARPAPVGDLDLRRARARQARQRGLAALRDDQLDLAARRAGGWAGARAAEAEDRRLSPPSGGWRGPRTCWSASSRSPAWRPPSRACASRATPRAARCRCATATTPPPAPRPARPGASAGSTRSARRAWSPRRR